MKGNALVKIHQLKTEVLAKYPELGVALYTSAKSSVATYEKMFSSKGWFDFCLMNFYDLSKFDEIEDVLSDMFEECNLNENYMKLLNRSASSGDIMTVDYGTHVETYLVMPIGFKKIEPTRLSEDK